MDLCNVNVEKIRNLKYKEGGRYEIHLTGTFTKNGGIRRQYEAIVNGVVVDMIMFSHRDEYISEEDDKKLLQSIIAERYAVK